MTVIDAHTHVQSIPNHMWDSPPERIIRLMDEAGVDQSIIMPYGEVTPEDPSLLDYTIESVEKFPDRLIGFARMHPAGEEKGVELFAQSVSSGKIHGLKFHPVGTMIHPADPRSVLFTQKAVELDVPILFHCGDEEWTLPFQIEKLMKIVPEAKIILGHMGGYFHVQDAITVAQRNPNCYLETSAMPDPRWIEKAILAIGPDRVIFGSDGPGCLPALELEKVTSLKLSPEVEEKVVFKNIAKLLGKK